MCLLELLQLAWSRALMWTMALLILPLMMKYVTLSHARGLWNFWRVKQLDGPLTRPALINAARDHRWLVRTNVGDVLLTDPA